MLAPSTHEMAPVAMFVGRYGIAFAAMKMAPLVPLWMLFMAVQLLDIVWAPLVLGVERVRIVPGIMATNPLDTALLACAIFTGVVRLLEGKREWRLKT